MKGRTNDGRKRFICLDEKITSWSSLNRKIYPRYDSNIAFLWLVQARKERLRVRRSKGRTTTTRRASAGPSEAAGWIWECVLRKNKSWEWLMLLFWVPLLSSEHLSSSFLLLWDGKGKKAASAALHCGVRTGTTTTMLSLPLSSMYLNWKLLGPWDNKCCTLFPLKAVICLAYTTYMPVIPSQSSSCPPISTANLVLIWILAPWHGGDFWHPPPPLPPSWKSVSTGWQKIKEWGEKEKY